MGWRMPEAPSAGPVEVELLPGLTWTLKPVDAEVECVVRGNTMRTMARLADGPQALAELGFEPGDYTRLSEDELRLGLQAFVAACWLALVALHSWNVVDDQDQPIEITPKTVNRILRIPAVHDSFTDWMAAPMRERRAEGNGSAAVPSGSGAAAASTAKAAGAKAAGSRAGRARSS